MRLSCMESDAGYLPWRQLKARFKVRVFLDGAPVDKVITADDEEGFVFVYAIDERGKPKLNDARDEILTERRAGVVRIELPPV